MILDEQFMYGVADAIKRLRPNAKFTIVDREITEWFDPDNRPKPSWEQVIEQYEADIKEFNRQEYARNRVEFYPSVGEQLDMLWHAIDSGQLAGKDTEWFKTIQEVKIRFPKQ